jgi:phenylacetate-CoA ligase
MKVEPLTFKRINMKKGKLEIWVKESITPSLKSLILTEAEKYFSDLELTLLENHDFRQQAGKLRDFISHLD